MKIIDLLNERDSYFYDYIKNRRNDLTQQILDPEGHKHQQRIRQQDREHELAIGSQGRAELKAKAEELAELKRQQRRKEALEDAELAFQRAETVAQRQAEMEKIKRQYQHDLDVINTNHRSNMEAIRTGNKHELDKMEKEHQHEKDMFDRQNPTVPQKPTNTIEIEPDLGPDDDDEKQSAFDQFKQDLNTIAAPQSLPGPDQKPPKKPGRYDNSDAVDVDFKEPGDEEDKKDKKDPPALPGPKKESISYYKNLIDQMEGRR